MKLLTPVCIAAMSAALVVSGIIAAPSASAQSRRELQQQIDQLNAQLTDAQQRLSSLEGDGDPAAVRIFERIDAIELQLQSLTGKVEQYGFANQRLCEDLRLVVRELQLRDREYAQAMNLPEEFVGFGTLDGLFEQGSAACAAANGVASPGFGGQASPGGVAAGGDPFARPDGGASQGPRRLGPGGDPFAGPNGAPSGQSPAGQNPGGQSQSSIPLSNNPQLAIRQAEQLILAGRYAEAESMLTQFVDRFPNDPLVAEAFFLRGETFFVRDAFGEAAADYISVIEADVDSEQAPEALVKLASSLNRLGEPQEACFTLDDFDRRFANADDLTKQKAARVRLEAGC